MSKPILIQEVESKAQKTYVDNLKISSLIPRGQLVNTTPSNDLNDAKMQGCYLILGTELNAPEGMGSFGTLMCYLGGTGAIVQEVTRQYTGTRWYREFNGSTWQSWRQIATVNNSLCVKDANTFGTDLNNANENGMYHIINLQELSNKPPAKENVGNLIVMSGTNNNSLSKIQYFIPFNNNGIYIRTRGYGLAEWQPWKEIVTTDKAMTKVPMLRTGDLKEHIKNLEQSCTFYVHADCTNTPIAGKYFICQVFCHINGAGYSDKHIEIQEYTSKRQFYADSWNKEAFVWKEYATLEKAEILPVLETGLTLVYNDTYKVNNMIFINVRLKKTDGSSFAQNTRLELCSFPVNKVIQTQCATLSCFRSVEWTSGYGIIYANGSSAKIRAYVDGASDVKEIVIGGVVLL